MLRKEFKKQLAKGEALLKANPRRHHGWDWWQLAEEEEKVFEIDRSRWLVMIEAWSAYEAFKKIVVGSDYDDAAVNAARANHPEWCGATVGADEFADFAKKLTGMTFRESHSLYAKMDAWWQRNIIIYPDEQEVGEK